MTGPSILEPEPPSKLNLHFVTGTFPADLSVERAAALARRGHVVTVLARQTERRLPRAPLPSRVTVQRLPRELDVHGGASRALQATARTLRAAISARGPISLVYERCRTNPQTREDTLRNVAKYVPFCSSPADVIHFESLADERPYPFVSDLTGIPTVVTCRYAELDGFHLRPPAAQTRMLESLRRAAGIHCESNAAAALVRRLTGERPGISIVPPAVNVETVRARAWPVPAGAPLRILAAGQLSWQSAFDYLLAALAKLRARGVAFEATIVGAGELLAPLRFSVGDLGLEGMVEIVASSNMDVVREHLQRSDLFVSPGHIGSMSEAILHAMAMGLPVISTRIGEIPEAIEDGNEGLLVPTRDVDALAAAIERFCSDRRLCEAMGRAGRARVERQFPLGRQVTSFEQLYESVRA